jgi:hypothetical protein
VKDPISTIKYAWLKYVLRITSLDQSYTSEFTGQYYILSLGDKCLELQHNYIAKDS